MEIKKVILGSSSKFRATILKNAGFEFTIIKPEIDEEAAGGDRTARNVNPSEIALKIAHAKADALLSKLTDQETPVNLEETRVLLALDQVVAYKGTIREKPENEVKCKEYLESYAYGPAETHSALVVIDLKTKKRLSGVDVARQYFKPIPSNIIEELIRIGDVLHCSGGFMIDADIIKPYLDKREGDEDSIIGMPLRLLKSLLAQL